MQSALTPVAEAISSFGKRLRLVFTGSPVQPERVLAQPAKLPELEFVAYAADCLLSGFIRLDAERLTDLLNAHDEYQLIDVYAEDLASGVAQEVSEIVVQRDELLLVHATGPRGTRQRRLRTRQFHIRLGIGPFEVEGNLHCSPGVGPIESFRRRRAMVPLTDATITYLSRGIPQDREVGSLIVNRTLVEWIVEAPDEETIESFAPLPGRDPNAKDLTGYVRTDPFGHVAGER
jgi:hypothetical protein